MAALNVFTNERRKDFCVFKGISVMVGTEYFRSVTLF